MKISLITDEISADPETAFELGASWGIHDFELRGFFADRVPRFSDYQKQRLRDALEEHGARVVAIAPGLFKIPFPSKEAIHSSLSWMERANYKDWAEARRHLRFHLDELLPASIDYACELGVPLIIIFGFHCAGAPAGSPPEELLDCLAKAAARAAAAGLGLAIETEEGFWADTGAHAAAIVQAVNHPALGINWDPANSFCVGDCPYPEGYGKVRGWVRHVHFKDAGRDAAGLPRFTLDGEIDWAGQVAALQADRYDGFISIETHLRPRIASARTALERLRSLMAGSEQ